MISISSGLPPSTAVAAFLLATGLAAIVEPSSVLDEMSRERLIQEVIQREELIQQVEQLIQQESSREQLIHKVRELKTQLAATTPTHAPEPEPERPRLMRSSSAKGGHVALSVDASGRVERSQEVAPGEPQEEQGGSSPLPRAQQPPLSDAALLQALLPADDLPQEHREDFHQTLHGDPEMAGSLLQHVRGLLYRALRHDEDFEDLEHEFDDSDDDLFDDEQLDADDDDQDEGAGPRRPRRRPRRSSSDGDDGKDVPDDVPGSAEGKDIRFAGLDPAHAEALQREMVDMKVIQLANIERQDARGNTREALELENAVIDMMKPRPTSNSTPPAALTATDGDENDQSASANKQRAARIVTDLVHAMDNIPEPIDEYEKLDVVPTEQDFTLFEKQVLGEQVKDLEEVGADKEKKGAPSSLMGRSETAQRSLLSRRFGAHGGAESAPPWDKPGGDGGAIWPRSGTYTTLKYCKGEGISSDGWKEFDKATKSLTEHCENLQFVEDSNDCKLTVKGDEPGCFANVGYSKTWARKVNLQDGNWWDNLWTGTCASKGIAEHELLHALGMYHEQSRSDRDMSYYPNNVKNVDGYGHNFETDPEASVQESYDLKSLMHYGCKSFSKNSFSDTLRANRRRRWWDGHAGRKDCSQMGQRSGLSGEDIRQLQRMYSCTNRRRAPTRRRRRRRWWR